MATIGAAGALGGAATSALLWDEEKFGTANNPNILQAGKLDLKVGWHVHYYNWIDDDGDTDVDEHEGDAHQRSSNGLTDQPGPIIKLEDVKPGDVFETTLTARVFGNPAFLFGHCEVHADSDNDGENNENMPEPEDKVNGHDPDNRDGTEGGDLGDALRCVVWHDDGNNRPDEEGLYTGEKDPEETKPFVMEVGAAQEPEEVFDLDSDHLIDAGTFNEVCAGRRILNPHDAVAGEPASGNFGNNEPSKCYATSTDEHIGVLCWIPRDIPGVNDNIIQTDRLEFQFGLDAIQCRHNVEEDGGPIDGNLAAADAENNADSPGS